MTYTHEDWKAEYRQLVKEKESFESYFHKHRKCRCKDDTCRHLKATEKALEHTNRMWELHIKHMNMGIQTLLENHPEWFTKRYRP